MNVLNYLNIEIELEDYNGNGMYDIKDFVKAPNEKILKYNKVMKFDCIVSNAPYNNGLHEKFEAKYFDICDGQIVWVSPLSFLLGKKQNKRITLELDKYKTDIEQINGNEYFDAAIGGTMGIVFCDMADEHNEHYVKFDGKQYNKCDEISTISNDELLIEFKNIIEPLCLENNLEKNMRAIPDDKHLVKYWYKKQKDDEYVIKIGIVRGNKDKRTGKNKEDFYSIISNNIIEVNKSIGIFSELYKQKNQFGKRLINFYIPTYSTNKNIAFNIVNYLKTDFCRAGLYLSKFNMNMYPNVFINIPWFDFSDPVFSKSPSEIDDYLFAKYIPEVDEETGITRDEIRKHIEELLPDYYNIRK